MKTFSTGGFRIEKDFSEKQKLGLTSEAHWPRVYWLLAPVVFEPLEVAGDVHRERDRRGRSKIPNIFGEQQRKIREEKRGRQMSAEGRRDRQGMLERGRQRHDRWRSVRQRRLGRALRGMSEKDMIGC